MSLSLFCFNVCCSLGALGVDFDGLRLKSQQALQHTVVMHIARMIPQGVSNVLIGFAGMGVQFNKLSHNFQNTMYDEILSKLSSMSEQQVANTIHS